MAQLILAPVTAAAVSTPFIVRTRRNTTAIATGLTGGEVATQQISPDDGKTWLNVLPADNLTVALPSRLHPAPGLRRYTKGITASPVAIYMATEDNA